MSFSLHSSTVNFGGGRRSWSSGSNSSSSRRVPVKSSIGLMSRKVSARPFWRKDWNDPRWISMRSGMGWTSSRFAKEKRSGVMEREGKGLLLRSWEATVCRGAPQHWLERRSGQRSGTATDELRRAQMRKQDPFRGPPTGQGKGRRGGGQGVPGLFGKGRGNPPACLTRRAGRLRLTFLLTPTPDIARFTSTERLEPRGWRCPEKGRPLLELDGGAGRLELRLGLLGILLGDLLQDGLGGAVDQVLGLLQAEVGQGAHLLDDLDLLVAG